jgi:hypothetical protein
MTPARRKDALSGSHPPYRADKLPLGQRARIIVGLAAVLWAVIIGVLLS